MVNIGAGKQFYIVYGASMGGRLVHSVFWQIGQGGGQIEGIQLREGCIISSMHG